MRNIKFRLIVMNFLQYAVWGSWLISLGAYLGGTLKFTGGEIGSFFATMGIASLFMPAIMGVIADRWIPAQRLLGISHLLAAAFMVAASMQDTYHALYPLVLCSVMFYMPTIALSNTVAYNALNKANLDTVKAFPPIRVWGTVGFICAMWVVDLLAWDSRLRRCCCRQAWAWRWDSTVLHFLRAMSIVISSQSRGLTPWACVHLHSSRSTRWRYFSYSR